MQLPHLRIIQADRQNGFISIEAEGDQRLTINAIDGNKANLPEVDPIDLPAPLAYAPSQRIVAAYRYFAGTPNITIADERFDRLPVPTAICRVASIHSVLSPAGEFQHQATFQFTAVGVQSLRVRFGVASDEGRVASKEKNAAELPTRHFPLATSLWAALVDGLPVEVRRADGTFLIPLRASDDPAAERSLQLFYRTNVPALRGTGELRQPPPELTVLNGAGVSQPMQVLDQQWELRYPPDLLLTDSQGAFVPDTTTPLDRTSWLTKLPKSLTLPRWSNAIRMIVGIVFVLIVIGAVALGRRWGRVAAVVLPLLVVGALYFTFAVQEHKNASPFSENGFSGGTDLVYETAKSDAVWFDRSDDSDIAAGSLGQRDGEGISLARRGATLSTIMPSRAPGTAPVDAPPMPQVAEKSEPMPQEILGKPGALSDPKKKSLSGKRMESQIFDRSESMESSPVPSDAFRQGSFGVKTNEEVKAAIQRNRKAMVHVDGPLKGDVTVEDMDDVLILRGNEQDVEGVKRIIDEMNRRGERGGLLSLTMAMESQDGAATKKFRYLGTETAASGIGLDLVYENHATGWTGRGVWIAALAFLAWVLPPNRRTFKASWAALGLTLPLALAAIAPLAWQNTLDGIFFGTVAAIALWTLRAAGDSLASAWPRMKTKSFWTRALTRRTAGG